MTDPDSCLPGRVVSRKLSIDDWIDPLGTSSYQTTAQVERVTEIEATRDQPQIDPGRRATIDRTLYLYRVGSAPHMYKHEPFAPARAQKGDKLVEWVARRMGISTREVRANIYWAELLLESQR